MTRLCIVVGAVLLGACSHAPKAQPATPIPTTSAPAAPAANATKTSSPTELAEAALKDDCQICHAIDLIEAQRLGPATWEKEIKKMVDWGAPVPPEARAPLATLLAERYGKDVPPASPTRLTAAAALAEVAPDEPTTHGDPERGGAIFRATCAVCHGPNAAGGPIGPALAGRLIVHRAHDFASTIRSGRRRMPAQPLDDASVADLLAFLRSVHG